MKSKALMLSAKGVVLAERLEPAGFRVGCSDDSFISENLGNDHVITFPQRKRREVAKELLEDLECQEDLCEPAQTWLEEPMDLELFGQSVLSLPEADEESKISEILALPSIPPYSSSINAEFFQSSPNGFFSVQTATIDSKQEELFDLSGEDDDIMATFEQLLQQIQPIDSATYETTVDQKDFATTIDDDETSALLDDLIQRHLVTGAILENIENIDLDAIAEVAVVLPPKPVELLPPPTVLSVVQSIDQVSSAESDEEWKPERRASKQRKMVQSGRQIAKITGINRTAPSRQRKKKLPVEDKKLRKKEQNKTAATRYRIKKKAELEILLEEEAVLLERNKKLQKKYDGMVKEVSYLKKLMREVFTARGIMK